MFDKKGEKSGDQTVKIMVESDTVKAKEDFKELVALVRQLNVELRHTAALQRVLKKTTWFEQVLELLRIRKAL